MYVLGAVGILAADTSTLCNPLRFSNDADRSTSNFEAGLSLLLVMAGRNTPLWDIAFGNSKEKNAVLKAQDELENIVLGLRAGEDISVPVPPKKSGGIPVLQGHRI